MQQMQAQINNLIAQITGGPPQQFQPPTQAPKPVDFGLPSPPFAVAATEEPPKEPRKRVKV
jgi:hypothetical protein